MGTAIRFRNTDVPRQNGEQARFKVVQGPDIGAVYILTGDRASIGRGETNDIVISDLKASRLHAEVSRAGADWVVKDLGSVNGILHNGKAAKSSPLRMGDTVTLGETTLEFMTAEAGTMMLRAPAQSIAQLNLGAESLDSQKERIRKMTSFGGIKELAAGFSGGDTGAVGQEQRRKMVIYAVAGLALFWALMEDEQPAQKAGKGARKPASIEKGKDADDLGKYLPKSDNPDVNKTADMFFKLGFREYREGNYLRAKANFETVLQVDPGHRLARIYLRNSAQAIETSVKDNLEDGKKSLASGKLRESKGNFEAVIRLLYYDQSNPAFQEAKDQLDEVKKQMSEGGVS